MKKVFYGLLGAVVAIFFLVFSFVRRVEITERAPEVVATNFVGFDLGKTAVKGVARENGENVKVEWAKEGVDIRILERAKIIIISGGASDDWVEEIAEQNSAIAEKCFRMMNYVDVIKNEAGDADEAVWTSPVNMMKILNQLNARMSAEFPEASSKISENLGRYAEEFNQIDVELREIVETGTRRRIIIGDEFVFSYLAKEYGFEVIKVSGDENIEDDVSVVFKTEVGDGKLAQAVAFRAGIRLLELHSGREISDTEFREGVTYVDLMRRNLGVLREAL